MVYRAGGHCLGTSYKVYLVEGKVIIPQSTYDHRMDSPEQTLARARQKDPNALTAIHDRYYPVIYRYVRYRMGDDPVCEDITAEVFLRLIGALHRNIGPERDLRAWLLGTASHLVNDHLRAKYRQRLSHLDGHEPDAGLSPEDSVERAWQRQEVRSAFLALTVDQQHVLALRFAEEYSLEETAQIMGKTIGAVKTLQFRALAALRRLLEEKSKQ